MMKGEPPAQVKAGAKQEPEENPRIERPGAQKRIERGVHCDAPWYQPNALRLRDGGRLCRLLPRRTKTDKKIDQGRHLGRLHLLAIGRHVAAAGSAIADLIDELIMG